MRHSRRQLPRKSHHRYRSSNHYSDSVRDVKYCHTSIRTYSFLFNILMSYYMAFNFTFSVPSISSLFIYTAINYKQNTQDRRIDRNWIHADIDTAHHRYSLYLASPSCVTYCATSLTPSGASESPENTVIVLLILCIAHLQSRSTRDAVSSSTHPFSAT